MDNKILILAAMLCMIGQSFIASERKQTKHPKDQTTIVYVEQYGKYFHVWTTTETAQKLKELNRSMHPREFIDPKGNFQILNAEQSLILTTLIINGTTFHEFK